MGRGLSITANANVVLCGSELGVLPLRAIAHGARRVVVLEPYPLDAKIATGIIRKNQLAAWHAEQYERLSSCSDDEKRASFETFAEKVVVMNPDSADLRDPQADFLVFPHFDQSLLGTGIAPAIQRCRRLGLDAGARILPGRAKVFAMGIQWRYPATTFELEPMNRFQWSLYPQAHDALAETWSALTEAVEVGEIDFGRFAETVWDARLPIRVSGRLDAILYWFELDLGATRLSNAPGNSDKSLKPAIQYADSPAVSSGEELPITVHVKETRLYFQTSPPVARPRSTLLPGWYMPMLHDRVRNAAYEAALALAAQSRELGTVLDIGAGCGLLSMAAARAGARDVYGCELSRALYETGQDVLKLNGLDAAVKLVNKDCRQLSVPTDLATRANFALFELFDCSLIGEGVLHVLAYAREHLLAPGARYLPLGARIRATIVEYRFDRVRGVDVGLLNPYRFAPGFINVDASTLSYRALCEPFDVFAFDFATATAEPATMETMLEPIAAGVAGAVLFWFDLQLAEQVWLSNEPGSSSPTHWKQGLQFLPEVRLDGSQKLPVVAKHDGSSLSFRWKDGGLPAELFLKLPRLDVHAWRDASMLEMQTREMMQRCALDPTEYAKLATLATQFAIDPGAHGLDPRVAQRFAELFFVA
jgi:hypothetical protein